VQNELKRTQNQPQLSPDMRALRVGFESFQHFTGLGSTGKDSTGRNRPVGGIQGTGREYENRGNEAKKYLKKKDFTFLSAVNYARFARNLAQIRA
jgi:hypothetical protein